MRSSAGKRELDLLVIDGVVTDRLDTCDVPVFLWAVEREIDCISLAGYMGKNPDIMVSMAADEYGINPLEPDILNIGRIREEFPDLVFWGGIDNNELRGTVEEVE